MTYATPAAQDAHYQALLADLLDNGAMMVSDLTKEFGAHKADAYERFSRAMRRTMVLGRHITANPLTVRDRSAEPRAPHLQPAPAETAPRDATPPDTGALRPEQLERPERPERLDPPEHFPISELGIATDLAADIEIATRTLGAAIIDIRRDLVRAPAKTADSRAHPIYVDVDTDDINEDDDDPFILESRLFETCADDG